MELEASLVPYLTEAYIDSLAELETSSPNNLVDHFFDGGAFSLVAVDKTSLYVLYLPCVCLEILPTTPPGPSSDSSISWSVLASPALKICLSDSFLGEGESEARFISAKSTLTPVFL